MQLYEKYKTIFDKYDVNTPLRIAHFMAQIETESGLKPISENLNYSATGLLNTFKRYFPIAKDSITYERKPMLIANRVYANRMGNGNEISGEGWKYRGRGFLQITGKQQYFQLHIDTDLDCLKNPDLLLEEPNALISALWFWNLHKLNALADQNNLDAISDTINIGHVTRIIGDANGYLSRSNNLMKWKLILKTK